MYWKLIKRNKSIVKSLGTDHDLLVFHEGNISQEQQRYIQNETPELRMTWIAVPWYFPQNFQLPSQSMETWRNGMCYPGYHLMCHFHTCDVWDYIKSYEKVLRVDEDCFLEGDWSGIFDTIDKGTPFRAAEGGTPTWGMHQLSDASLQEHFPEVDMKKLSVFSTQVFVSFTDFWYSPKVVEYINKFKQFDGSRKWRWGDQETYSIMFNVCDIHADTFQGFTYFHESHQKWLGVTPQ